MPSLSSIYPSPSKKYSNNKRTLDYPTYLPYSKSDIIGRRISNKELLQVHSNRSTKMPSLSSIYPTLNKKKSNNKRTLNYPTSLPYSKSDISGRIPNKELLQVHSNWSTKMPSLSSMYPTLNKKNSSNNKRKLNYPTYLPYSKSDTIGRTIPNKELLQVHSNWLSKIPSLSSVYPSLSKTYSQSKRILNYPTYLPYSKSDIIGRRIPNKELLQIHSNWSTKMPSLSSIYPTLNKKNPNNKKTLNYPTSLPYSKSDISGRRIPNKELLQIHSNWSTKMPSLSSIDSSLSKKYSNRSYDKTNKETLNCPTFIPFSHSVITGKPMSRLIPNESLQLHPNLSIKFDWSRNTPSSSMYVTNQSRTYEKQTNNKELKSQTHLSVPKTSTAQENQCIVKKKTLPILYTERELERIEILFFLILLLNSNSISRSCSTASTIKVCVACQELETSLESSV